MTPYEPPPDSPPVRPPDTPVAAGGPEPPRPGPRGLAFLAWLVIIAIVVMRVMTASGGGEPAPPGAADPINEMLMGIQGRYLVGAADFTATSGEVALAQSTKTFNVGSLGQRQRFVVLAAELGSAAVARSHLNDLQSDIDGLLGTPVGPDGEPFALTEGQAAVQRALRRLYPPGAEPGAAPAIDALDADDRAALTNELGWFGELALAPVDAAGGTREPVLASARRTFLIVLLSVSAVGLAGVVGFIGLIIAAVLAFGGNLRRGVVTGNAYHGIYAETFAVWLIVFMGGELGVANLWPGAPMLLHVGVFFGSLLALAWAPLRGVPWRTARRDIGWIAGPTPVLEPFAGIGCYAMALPIVAVGVTITALLVLFVQPLLAVPSQVLAPAGGPAHPIIAIVGGGSWWMFVQVLVLGAVAAPIVEETMFRGVLYRHLREASARLGMFVSIIASTLVNGFVFAAIHPQGWLAVPALMGLATGFTLAREWRGTIIPAVVMHGVSNALVLSLVRAMAMG